MQNSTIKIIDSETKGKLGVSIFNRLTKKLNPIFN